MNNKFIKLSLLSLLMISGLSSCDKTEDVDDMITVYLNQTEIPYDDNGIWANALTESSYIISQNVVFSHEVIPEWNTWNGFIASRSSDISDYSDSFAWMEHQYTAITGGGISGAGTPYLIAYWNSSEGSDIDSEQASCHLTYGTEKKAFIPQSAYITNTSYCYYTMLNGSPFSKKFSTGDYFNLLIYGVKTDGTKTGPVKFALADYSNDTDTPINTWEYVNLEELGEVVGIIFQMESSDTGMFGINTPTYFAADRITIKLI